MKIVPVLAPRETRAKLLALIDECEAFYWASAWLTKSPVFDAAIASQGKLGRFVVGTHQYMTDADCLEACVGIPEVRVVSPEGRMFHPKVYAFQLKRRLVVYLGSSNLTDAGLSRNIECGVFLSAAQGDSQLQCFIDFIDQQWLGADTLDDEFVEMYRANQRRVKDAQEALKQFVRFGKPRRSVRSANQVDPHRMSWNRFVGLVCKDRTNGLKPRLRVLSEARRIFAKGVRFERLPEIERKSLAGILKPAHRDGVDWGYFGQMSAFGRYNPILREHSRIFSKALDHIPIIGTVKKAHFDAYLDAFRSVPDSAPSWIGLGTRLLAMKRPDQFVCIDNANRHGLCAHFGTAPTTTNLDNYWERIVAPMMLMPWWQTEMPQIPLQQQIWMGRAAMLDAIYFDPER